MILSNDWNDFFHLSIALKINKWHLIFFIGMDKK